jgi:hypothetical protein
LSQLFKTPVFEPGTASAWAWAKPAEFIRWFSDGERRYGTSCSKLASVALKAGEADPDYGHRKVWRQGLEVAMKIKGSQGKKRVEWVKVEHPFTALSPASDVHANHGGSAKQCVKAAFECLSATTESVCQTSRGVTTGFVGSTVSA